MYTFSEAHKYDLFLPTQEREGNRDGKFALHPPSYPISFLSRFPPKIVYKIISAPSSTFYSKFIVF